MADLLGLVLLTLQIGALAAIVGPADVPATAWAFAVAMTAAVALYVWRHPKAPPAPSAWLCGAVWTVPLATAVYGLLTLTSVLSMGHNASALSRGVDLAIAWMVAPGLTVIALAGAARAAVRKRLDRGASAS